LKEEESNDIFKFTKKTHNNKVMVFENISGAHKSFKKHQN